MWYYYIVSECIACNLLMELHISDFALFNPYVLMYMYGYTSHIT